MLDDLRSYLQMASGLTEATAAKARDAVTGLLAHGVTLGSRAIPDAQVVGQVQDLADDLVSTSRANREALTAMIRAEVDKAVARMGFVREEELAAVRRHVQRLEAEIEALREPAASPEPAVSPDAAVSTDAAVSPEPAVSTDGASPEAVASPEPAVSTDAADVPGDADAPGGADAPAPVKKKKILVDPATGDA